MLREMSAVQLEEWHAFSELEVLPTERMRWLFGSLLLVLTNANLGKGHRKYRLDEMLISFGDANEKKKMGWRELRDLAREWTADSIKKAERRAKRGG